MLIKASKWITETFRQDSRPDMQTVKKWIKSGDIDGSIIGSIAFIETGIDYKESKPESKKDCVKTFKLKQV